MGSVYRLERMKAKQWVKFAPEYGVKYLEWKMAKIASVDGNDPRLLALAQIISENKHEK